MSESKSSPHTEHTDTTPDGEKLYSIKSLTANQLSMLIGALRAGRYQMADTIQWSKCLSLEIQQKLIQRAGEMDDLYLSLYSSIGSKD